MHCYVVAAGVPCGSPDRLAEAVHRGVRLKRDGNAISTTQKVSRLRVIAIANVPLHGGSTELLGTVQGVII